MFHFSFRHRLSVCLLCLILLLCACQAVVEAPDGDALPPAASSLPAVPSAGPASADPDLGKLRISELMAKNRATLQAPDGAFYDWIELENIASEPVSLAGWGLSDGEGKPVWSLPALTLEPGGQCVFFAAGQSAAEGCAPFSLSEGEAVCLYTPGGTLADCLRCPAELKADRSLSAGEEAAVPTDWATPGQPNTREGYEVFAASRSSKSPLQIYEVMTANISYPVGRRDEILDWVELKNCSEQTLELSDYWLSDDAKNYRLFRLPEGRLAPGATTLIVCDADSRDPNAAPFSLDAVSDRLFLSAGDEPLDYLYLHDVPRNGSVGRMDGEDGFFYFAAPTPGKPNAGGMRRVSACPELLDRDGVFNDVPSVAASLLSGGEIYYTLDGGLPDQGSERYTGPLSLSETCVLRAIAVEEGALPSRAVSFSFIINEGHKLPVLSLTTDDVDDFAVIYRKALRRGFSGNLCGYLGEDRFSIDCGIRIGGKTSRGMQKKTFNLKFGGVYGQDTLDCDLFGTGFGGYHDLVLRAGSDNERTIIRNELMQELCLEFSDALVTQHSRFCVLYVNGDYRGIYCMKEKINRQFCADRDGGEKDATELYTVHILQGGFLRDVLDYAGTHDMADPACYAHICELLDVDSLIDWIVLEGYSGNWDILFGNVSVYRSNGPDARWRVLFYDLDEAFLHPEDHMRNVFTLDYELNQMAHLIRSLLRNPDFSEALKRRFAEAMGTVLTNDHVLGEMDRLFSEIEPEAARNFERWQIPLEDYRSNQEQLRQAVSGADLAQVCIREFCEYLHISEDEWAALNEP